MGIDIQTYRRRIGSFVPNGGSARMMSFLFDCSKMVRLIGAAIFIGMLLLMAGVEPNPGPADKVFTFRYQYLLIEVGTSILRKLFDHQVGPDFKQYLDKNPVADGQLKFLISKGKISTEQQQLIPPVDNKPLSSNYDITLLCCLLRNACGLRVFTDNAWIKPLPIDTSVEANVTRLRECRNKLMHSGSVFDFEPDMTAKWAELCSILTELGNFCGFANLQSLIDKAKTADIDENVKEIFDKMVNAWTEMDNLFDHGLGEVVSTVQTMVKEQQKTNTRLDNVEQTLKESKPPYVENMTDIQQKLTDVYQAGCSRLTMSPLFKDENKELLKIYKIPSLFVVDYHKAKTDQVTSTVTSCKDIFYKDQQPCRNIYITGDAGVGKSSFCKYLSLLWSMSKLGNKINSERMQKDADFVAMFDFIFYVTLRDTDRTDVIAMIVDQLFNTECDDKWSKLYESVNNILKCEESLVILDGLDEWKPKQIGKKDYEIPYRPTGKKCMYVTTCRPYKIENVRLFHEDLDQQVTMTGIHGSSMEFYVAEILNHINEKYSENKDPLDFFREVKQCGLHELLCIPIITSHLIMVWLYQPLTAMSRSLIYGNIVDMLFKIAKDREVEFPASTSPDLQLPDSLSKLQYFTEHFSLLEKVCLLSFRSLFKQDECVTNLVFTNQQLMSQPYFLSSREVDFLCKVGILSKNKVIRQFGKQEHRLSFLHLSYLEFFAAMFVSSFETGKLSDTFNTLTTINDVLQFENFFLFFAGFSSVKLFEFLFQQMFTSISDELTSCRKKAICHYNSFGYSWQIRTLQNTVINCFKEGSTFTRENVYLKLEDFIFNDSTDVDYLKRLLLLNRTCIKSIYSVKGKYYDEFDQIKTLQCLHVGKVLSGDFVKFTDCMLQNQSTLHTVGIKGYTLIPELPVRSLQHLTSLSLSDVTMQYNSLHNLVNFLSDNVLIESIKLSSVSCDNLLDENSDWDDDGDEYADSDCTLTLNLPHHTKLTSLCLYKVNILCNNVNNSSLKSISLFPLSERIASCYVDVFNCIKYSQLEHLYVNGSVWCKLRYIPMLDYNTVKTLSCTVKTLPYIKSLSLRYFQLPDDILLQLHPDVTQVRIALTGVIISRQCFHCFIDSFVHNKYVIKVELYRCNITSVDGETRRVLSDEESEDYLSKYLTAIPTVNITRKDDTRLHVEKTNCQ